MSTINRKHVKNAYTNNSPYGSGTSYYPWRRRNSFDQSRAGYPSDFIPRKICQVCGEEFRVIDNEGFTTWDISVCRQCICSLVRDKVAENKRRKELEETEFNARLDDISTQ